MGIPIVQGGGTKTTTFEINVRLLIVQNKRNGRTVQRYTAGKLVKIEFGRNRPGNRTDQSCRRETIARYESLRYFCRIIIGGFFFFVFFNVIFFFFSYVAVGL